MKLFLSILLAIIITSSFANTIPNFGFIENKGQIAEKKGVLHPEITHKLELSNVNAYLKPEGIIYHFHKTEPKTKQEYTTQDQENYSKGDFNLIRKKEYFFRLDFNLINANKKAIYTATSEQDKKYNFYLAHCPNGILGVRSFEEITYSNIYPNIDIKYYYKDNALKYEFIVRPGGDINTIAFWYQGAKSINIKEGALVIENDFNAITEQKPSTYYYDSKKEIASGFRIKKESVVFDIVNYDRTKTIVIDPTVTWASYYNNGFSQDGHTNSVFDSNENIFTAYSTSSSFWPVINAGTGQYFDATFDGFSDVIIAKINSNYSIAWATYYGGDDYDAPLICDYGKAIGIDANNNIYVGGITNNNPTVFPTQASPTPGAFYQDQSKLYGGDNSFLLKFDNNGVRQWATLFQHEQPNTLSAGMRLNGICVNGSKIYFTGQTYKFNNNNIPLRTLAGAYNNPTFVGNQDAFIGRFNSDCALEWSTYFNGGNASQTAFKQGSDLDVDQAGNLVYTGQITGTNSASAFLLNSGGGTYYSGTPAGGGDIQIAKFNTNMQPIWSTFYGSSDLDRVSEVSTDINNNIILACRIIGGVGLPTLNAGGSFYNPTKQSPGSWTAGGNHDGAIIKFTSAGTLYWSTYIGGTNNGVNSITGVTSDALGNIFAIGHTNATNFPMQNLAGSYNQSAYGGGSMDMILMKFTATGGLLWGSYYGGSGMDYNYGVKLKPSSIESACGLKYFHSFITNSANVPLVNPGPPAFYEGTFSTAYTNGLLLLQDVSIISPTITATSTNVACGSSVTLTAIGATSYTWSTGATTSSIVINPFTNSVYTVVVGAGTCTSSATQSITVTSSATPTISVSSSSLSCGGSATLIASGATSYTWSTGATTSSIVVTPANNTTYTLLGENGACINSATQSITVTPPATPSITASSISINCGSSTTLTASGATSYTWNTGATTSSIVVTPTGNTSYTVLSGSGTCTISATTSITVNSALSPTITTSSNNLACGGSATLIANGATSYTWSTGETTSGIIVTPSSNTSYTVLSGSGTCTSSAVQTISVSNAITPTITASSATVSCGASATLAASGSTSYSWSTGATTSSIVVTPNGTITYTVLSGSGSCTNNATITVTEVNSLTTLTISPDVTISAGSQTQLAVIGNASSYLWSPSLGLSCITCTNPIANPLVTTNYCVVAAIGTCTSQACVLVTVEVSCESNKMYDAPNAFSPNGDGVNDQFCLEGWKGCVNSFYIAIYNRWGNKVFESEDEAFCWDGKYQGQTMDPAVFVFYIKADVVNKGSITKKGNITLIK